MSKATEEAWRRYEEKQPGYTGVLWSARRKAFKVFGTNSIGRYIDDVNHSISTQEQLGHPDDWTLVYVEKISAPKSNTQKRLAELQQMSPEQLEALVRKSNPNLGSIQEP